MNNIINFDFGNILRQLITMKKNAVLRLLVFMIGGGFLIGCEETKRYEITSDDTTPPGTPVFIDSKPLAGGARVYFRIPVDEDVLMIEASYKNTLGETVRSTVSYFTDSLDVLGFGSEGEHDIDLCAIDRAGNRSTPITETVVSLEPPVVSVAKTIKVLPSFGSLMLKWQNELMQPIYVSTNIRYKENGVEKSYNNIFSSYQLNDKQRVDNL